MNGDIRRHRPSIEWLIGAQQDDVQIRESGEGSDGRCGAQPLSRVGWLARRGKRDQKSWPRHRLDSWVWRRRRVSAAT
jgi:hypothetical protein